MFDFTDRRTDAERRRDLEAADKLRAEAQLALGFLKNNVRPLLAGSGATVGIAGLDWYAAELLVEVGVSAQQ